MVLGLGQFYQPQKPLSQPVPEPDLVTTSGTWKTSLVGSSEAGPAARGNLHRWVLPVMGPTCQASHSILLQLGGPCRPLPRPCSQMQAREGIAFLVSSWVFIVSKATH